MNWPAWLLVGWMVGAVVSGVFAAWSGWHLRRGRHGRAPSWTARNRTVGQVRRHAEN